MMAKLKQKYVRICRTANLYFSFFALGLCMAIPGPTLLDLQHVVQTDTSHVAFIYLARSSGYLLGSLLGGILFDCISKKQPLLIMCNLVMSISAIATPWSRNLVTLLIAMSAGGLSMGAIDTGGNVWCLNLWGRDSGPYFQALHFVFGLGAFLSPLIAEPFLSNHCTDFLAETRNTSLNSSEEFSNFASSLKSNIQNCSRAGSLLTNNASGLFENIPTVTYAYGIIGAYSFLVMLLFVIMFALFPQEQSVNIGPKKDNSKESGILFTVAVVLLTTILLCIYAGIEIGYGQMIATFAVKGPLKLSKSLGSFMTSVFWGTFTFSRGISIFLSSRFTPLSLILSDLVLMVLAGVVLLAFGSSYVEFLWAGTAIIGVGLASFYPTTISWVERYINVSNKVASLFVVAASLGEMVMPLTISQFIDIEPQILMYVVILSEAVCCILTFMLWAITKNKEDKYDAEDIPPEEHTELNESRM